MSRLTMLDLFAGCGGLTDGFEQSQLYRTVAAVEWDKSSSNTLERRLRDKWGISDAKERVLTFDIQRTKELLKGWQDADYGINRGLYGAIGKEEVDLIVGGPPCQAYSLAGRIRDVNGMQNDYRNYLFESYIRVVKEFRPKAFVFENVLGMLSAKPGGVSIIERVKKDFEEAGYAVSDDIRQETVIEMKEYGIPQDRKRIVIVGLSKDLYGKANARRMIKTFYSQAMPSHKEPIRNVADAIGDLPEIVPAEAPSSPRQSHNVLGPPIPNHEPRYHSKRDIDIFRELTEDIEKGKNRYRSTEALKELYTLKTGKISSVHKYHVLKWDRVSNTIVAHLYKDGLRHIHPSSAQARSITVREAARLQTFPDDFLFYGSKGDQYKMVGNAVPPYFAYKLANALYEILNKGGVKPTKLRNMVKV